MIDSITGIIQRKEPTNLFIDMNGMVFNISICLRDYEELPDLNQEITILTYLNVREDLMELYGFLEYERRRLFTQLIGVSGIGPRTAINQLSNISVANFKENIIAEDVKSLSLIPGIGPKTAKRIILDIREKVTKDRATTDGLDTSNINFTYDDIYDVVKDKCKFSNILEVKDNDGNPIDYACYTCPESSAGVIGFTKNNGTGTIINLPPNIN